MKNISKDLFIGNYSILFDNHFLDRQKIAGKCVSACLKKAEEMILNCDKLSSKMIEKECLQIINEHHCEPTFLNYLPKGSFAPKIPFPAAICTSINNQLVHGIPNDSIFQDGDIIKIDLGATYKGAIADAAKTFIKGKAKSSEHEEMQILCKKALSEAIKSVKIGQKTGIIGYTINKVIKNSQYRVITDYGGHGISFDYENNQPIPHSYPFIPNKSQINDGIRIQSGMTFAIEPLLKKGDNRTWIASDGWTVMVDSVSFHEEHTLFVTENEVITITE